MVRVMGRNCEDFPSPIMCVGGMEGGGRMLLKGVRRSLEIGEKLVCTRVF